MSEAIALKDSYGNILYGRNYTDAIPVDGWLNWWLASTYYVDCIAYVDGRGGFINIDSLDDTLPGVRPTVIVPATSIRIP